MEELEELEDERALALRLLEEIKSLREEMASFKEEVLAELRALKKQSENETSDEGMRYEDRGAWIRGT
jgi:hypothetical protein